MDDGDKEKLEAEMMNQGSVRSYHTPSLPSNWHCRGVEDDLITPVSYAASVWESHPSDSHPLEFNGINAHTHSSVAGFMDSFAISQSASPYDQLIAPMSYGPHGVFMDGSMSSDHRNQRYTDEAKLANSDESDSGGNGCQEEPSPSKGCCPKKRKRGSKDAEIEQSQQLSGGDGDATDNSKHSSPLKPKEDYIHVRARRGQATNSHSLAERVRREKIRERMKLLQDLVPGCSKVTGKAVMLDEIINYVQSLQRQVEFLSMKLATVDPRMDFNVHCVLAKEQMFAARAGPSSLGLSTNMQMAYPFMNPPQPSVSVIGSSSDAFRNLDSQLTSLNEGYKEPTPQMPNVWDDELQNVIQMGFSPSAPLDNQETPRNSSLAAVHMKAEL